MSGEKVTKAVQRAAQAHTNLSMFHAIIALVESGSFYGHQPETTPIIAAARRGAARCLREYDRAGREALRHG